MKIGLCYLNLHDPTRAQQVWQRVVREYPHEESATLAQTLLRTHTATRR